MYSFIYLSPCIWISREEENEAFSGLANAIAYRLIFWLRAIKSKAQC